MATAAEAVRPACPSRSLADVLAALGGVAADRVRLKAGLGPADEADLLATNAAGPALCELVDDFLVEKGMGYAESILALVLAGFLRDFVVPGNLGLVSGADGMMRLGPGLVRVPDVAFTSWERIPRDPEADAAIAPFAPDLAVEILRLGNTPGEMARKRDEYFAAGVRLVWEVDPRARVVTVFEPTATATRVDGSGRLDGGAVLPGFALEVRSLFAELDRVRP